METQASWTEVSMLLTSPTKSELAWTKAFVVPSIWRAAMDAEPPLNSEHPCVAAIALSAALHPFESATRAAVAANTAAGARRKPARKPFRFFMKELLRIEIVDPYVPMACRSKVLVLRHSALARWTSPSQA